MRTFPVIAALMAIVLVISGLSATPETVDAQHRNPHRRTPTPALNSTPTATSIPGATPTATATIPAGTLPPQGLYDDCLPNASACLGNLTTMGGAGFKLVINYSQWYATAAQQLAYADRAQAAGMQVIWGMSDPAWLGGTNLRTYYSDMAASCGCSTNAGFIAYAVNLVKGHPATWGYYIGDEASPGQHTAVVNFVNQVRAADPNHPRLFISGEDEATLGANLKPFVDTCDVCGSDVYPIGRAANTANDPLWSVGTTEATIKTYGKPTAMVLQAFSWSQGGETWPPNPTQYPSRTQMRTMRDLALSNGPPVVIFWYSFWHIIQKDGGVPGAHWADVVAAALAP